MQKCITNQILNLMKKLILLSFAALSFTGNAQTTTPTTPAPTAPAEKEWDVSVYGFIRADYIGTLENHQLLEKAI